MEEVQVTRKNRILVGSISPEGSRILNMYLQKFVPDASIEPLRPVGIKNTMARQARSHDVIMVILNEDLYALCKDLADAIKPEKLHKYIDDNRLNQYLITRFGENLLDSRGSSELEDIDSIEDDYIPRQDFSGDGDIHVPLPDSLIISSEDDDYDEVYGVTVGELRDKLARSELMVRNLTMQLSDIGDDDTSALIARIRELEEIVEEKNKALESTVGNQYETLGKITWAESIIGEVDSLKQKLQTSENNNAKLQFDNNKLLAKTNELDSQLEELQIQVAEIGVVKESLVKKQIEINEKDVALKTNSEQIIALRKQLSELTLKYNALVKNIQEKDKILGEQARRLSELNKQIGAYENALNQYKVKIAQLETDIADLQTSKETLKSELESTISSLQQESEDLQKEHQEVVSNLQQEHQETLDNVQKEHQEVVANLQSELEEAKKNANQERVEELQKQLGVVQTTLEHKEAELDLLREDVKEKRTKLSELTQQIATIEEAKKVSAEALDNAIAEKQALNDKIVALEEERLKLESEKTTLNNGLLAKNTEVIELQSTVVLKDKEISGMQADIDLLNARLLNNTADDTEFARLEQELLAERRKSARLASEIEIMKKSDDSDKSAELRVEIANLRIKLEEAKSASENTEELENLRSNLLAVRERCSSLELDIVDRDEQINELTSGIFGQMASLALPRVAYNLGVAVPDQQLDNFYCLASGSDESSTSLYQVLKRTCLTDTTKRILVIDLVTDSSIDRDFGIQSIKSPIEWLLGTSSYQPFLAPTNYRHIRVMSTALAYLNSLFLLQVDWKARLQELVGVADIVILNIGSLNDVITKILFSSFSKVMKTYVIAKSSPVNLRSTFLSMSGIRPISPNVTIECVNFDDRTSRTMYMRLSKEYNAQILKDTEILKL